MTSNGEDIIRETFEKLGDAIGVQMQMPDAMITNLGAVLQAQIDLLAELQSTGRLIPAGGVALTAEQVEDVRTVVNNSPMEIYDATERGRYYAAAARLRALFPATEHAEECQNDNHNPGCVCGAQHWMTSPAPAEPAEEATKADTSAIKRDAWFKGYDACRQGDQRHNPHPASSSVIPAPTETGPWATADDVPDDVKFVSKGNEGWHSIWMRCGKGSTDYADLNNPKVHELKGYQIWHVSAVNELAPFVAAEEG